jgi:hypothetical protein
LPFTIRSRTSYGLDPDRRRCVIVFTGHGDTLPAGGWLTSRWQKFSSGASVDFDMLLNAVA